MNSRATFFDDIAKSEQLNENSLRKYFNIELFTDYN